MTLCPVAIAVGCRKCPAFGFCPLKGAIGDFKPDEDAAVKQQAGADNGDKTRAR